MFVFTNNGMEPIPPSAMLGAWQDKTRALGYETDQKAIDALKQFIRDNFKPSNPDVQYLVRQGLIADTSEPVLAYYGLTRLLNFSEDDARDFIATAYPAPVAAQAAEKQELHDLQVIIQDVNQTGASNMTAEDRNAIVTQTQVLNDLSDKQFNVGIQRESDKLVIEVKKISTVPDTKDKYAWLNKGVYAFSVLPIAKDQKFYDALVDAIIKAPNAAQAGAALAQIINTLPSDTVSAFKQAVVLLPKDKALSDGLDSMINMFISNYKGTGDTKQFTRPKVIAAMNIAANQTATAPGGNFLPILLAAGAYFLIGG